MRFSFRLLLFNVLCQWCVCTNKYVWVCVCVAVNKAISFNLIRCSIQCLVLTAATVGAATIVSAIC